MQVRKVVVVSGVPGVGKTTVVTDAIRKVADRLNVSLITYGSVMFEIAKKQRLVEDRDEVRKLPVKVQREVQKLAGERIAAMSRSQVVVVDTHTLIQTSDGGFLIGLPQWVAEALRPASIVLVEADSKNIASRRAKDESRTRDEQLVESIDRHQELSRAAAIAVGTLTGATVMILKNVEGKAEEAATAFAELLLKV
ncbi:MAG: adenylate kinase [Candidatus Hermodarchaeota archaeon]|nr:adenylate kinase [Candidatus Hermodarchaeota archaeon]